MYTIENALSDSRSWSDVKVFDASRTIRGVGHRLGQRLAVRPQLAAWAGLFVDSYTPGNAPRFGGVAGDQRGDWDSDADGAAELVVEREAWIALHREALSDAVSRETVRRWVVASAAHARVVAPEDALEGAREKARTFDMLA